MLSLTSPLHPPPTTLITREQPSIHFSRGTKREADAKLEEIYIDGAWRGNISLVKAFPSYLAYISFERDILQISA